MPHCNITTTLLRPVSNLLEETLMPVQRVLVQSYEVFIPFQFFFKPGVKPFVFSYSVAAEILNSRIFKVSPNHLGLVGDAARLA